MIRPMSLYNQSITCALDALYTCGSRKIFRKLIFFDRCAIFIVLHLPEAADAENATDLLNSFCMRASCALLANSPRHRAATTPAYYIVRRKPRHAKTVLNRSAFYHSQTDRTIYHNILCPARKFLRNAEKVLQKSRKYAKIGAKYLQLT